MYHYIGNMEFGLNLEGLISTCFSNLTTLSHILNFNGEVFPQMSHPT